MIEFLGIISVTALMAIAIERNFKAQIADRLAESYRSALLIIGFNEENDNTVLRHYKDLAAARLNEITRLQAELKQARKNDNRDEKGRFTKA